MRLGKFAHTLLRELHVLAKRVDEVVAVLERTRLTAVAVDRDVLVAKRLHDEVRDHTAVLRMHARSVGIEDAHHPRVDIELANTVRNQRLAHSFAFVVAAADANRVDIAPLMLLLRMHQRIAVDFARRAMEQLRVITQCELEAEEDALDGRHRREHRTRLIVDRRGGTCEIVDLVELHALEAGTLRGNIGDIPLQETEARIIRKAPEILPGTRV